MEERILSANPVLEVGRIFLMYSLCSAWQGISLLSPVPVFVLRTPLPYSSQSVFHRFSDLSFCLFNTLANGHFDCQYAV
jgi:hypothetical protein